MSNKKLKIRPSLELQIKVLEGLTGKAGVTRRQSLLDESLVLNHLLTKSKKHLELLHYQGVEDSGIF